MNIMPVRIGLFKVVTALYQKTGISLLKYADHSHLVPLEYGFGGEAGAFYFVPLVATAFNCSSFVAARYFFIFLVATGACIAGSAFFYTAKTFLGKSISIIGVLLLSFVAWKVGDVYIAYFFAVSFFPWMVVLVEEGRYKTLLVYCLFSGIMLEYAHFIRSYAALPVLFGIVVLFLIFYKKNLKKIILPLVFLSFGIGLVRFHIFMVIKERNTYLKKKKQIVDVNYPLTHTFWHNIYMGFGFITNDYGLDFSDSCSATKVQSVDPTIEYLKKPYEEALRNETIKLCIAKPHYVLRVLFAKFGVLFYFFLIFANVGIIAAYRYPKPFYTELSYWSLIFMSLMPGILTIPISTYLLGFISACAFYGVYSILYALNNGLRFL